jgi:AraC family transcriptional regulator
MLTDEPRVERAPPHPNSLPYRGGLPGGALDRVRAYIDAHLGEHITLEDLARQVGVSRFHFAREFRHSTGESPMEYLRRIRIQYSLRLLLRRDATIGQVAARLGFADQSHFTRIFVRLIGMSPGAFLCRTGWNSNDGAA